MVRPEKGSLADRSDIRNRVRIFRTRNRQPENVVQNVAETTDQNRQIVIETNGQNVVGQNVERQNVERQNVVGQNVVETNGRNVEDRLSPVDVSFGSSGTRASASKVSPASFQSSR